MDGKDTLIFNFINKFIKKAAAASNYCPSALGAFIRLFL